MGPDGQEGQQHALQGSVSSDSDDISLEGNAAVFS